MWCGARHALAPQRGVPLTLGFLPPLSFRCPFCRVSFVFVGKDGKEIPVTASVGENLVHVAHANNVDLEGACECSLACSTCHVVLEDKVYRELDAPVDEEEDLLDLAFGLTATSRLGCQVKVQKSHEGMKVKLPAATRNFYVDGHKPKPH